MSRSGRRLRGIGRRAAWSGSSSGPTTNPADSSASPGVGRRPARGGATHLPEWSARAPLGRTHPAPAHPGEGVAQRPDRWPPDPTSEGCLPRVTSPVHSGRAVGYEDVKGESILGWFDHTPRGPSRPMTPLASPRNLTTWTIASAHRGFGAYGGLDRAARLAQVPRRGQRDGPLLTRPQEA